MCSSGEIINKTKQETWELAMNGLVENVKATGDISNPSLSGINGLELKKLESENLNVTKQITVYDIQAYVVRNMIKNKINIETRSLGQIKSDALNYMNSTLDIINLKKFSGSLSVLGVTEDKTGYLVKNIQDNNSLPIIECVDKHTLKTKTKILSPGEQVLISKETLVITASAAEYGNTLQNGHISIKLSQVTGKSLKEIIDLAEFIPYMPNSIQTLKTRTK